MGNKSTLKALLAAQRNEISEYHTYSWLAGRIKDEKNREIVQSIGNDERRHYEVIKQITGVEVKPHMPGVLFYRIISILFGLSFGLRLMEKGEKSAERTYVHLKETVPELAEVFIDEEKHEKELLGMINEEMIEYAGSMVLGLNDALMELTGVLAGLTFALQNGKIIGVIGFITGLAASMSMAASEYLSVREEADKNSSKSSLRSAFYTGITYIITVLILIAPYFLFRNVYISLAVMLASSIIIILTYTFYITTAKGLPLWRRFGEMALISASVAGISFVVGVIMRMAFHVEV
jgi:VIT1/CCC1 family predicted Fe2+/Mn2+ transporter